jgi:hypothetical protein
MKNGKFEDVLNLCIERLLKGESIERCLTDYPAQARELEPLLRTFAAARTASQVKPRAEFKAQAKYEFQVALANLSRERRPQPAGGWHWRWRSAWSIAIMTVLVIIIGGAGTVVAAGRSMPDSPLYSVKLLSENVQLALTPSGLGKAELNAQIADRRVQEINYMAQKGNAEEVLIVAGRLESNLQNIVNLAGGTTSGQERASSAAPSNALSAPAKGAAGSDNSQVAMGAVPNETTAAPSPAQPPLAVPATTATMSAPATASVPPTTTATLPIATPSMSVEAVPPPGALTGSAAQPAPGQTGSNVSQPPATAPVSGAAESEKVKIARVLVESTQQELAKLNSILDNASNEVRPAVKQAIAQAQVELDRAMQILQELLASGQ